MANKSLVFFVFAIEVVCGFHIIWDKDAELVDFNEIDFARTGEVRMPNWLFIYPGTKWCGVGNIADNDTDLGKLRNTDKCCREHDKCKDIIEGYQSAHNLTNNRFYTKLNCNCDDQFHRCLKSLNTRDSITVGNIYFNALGTECFKLDFPIVDCEKYKFVPLKKCVKYRFQEAVEKIYQWFDVPIF